MEEYLSPSLNVSAGILLLHRTVEVVIFCKNGNDHCSQFVINVLSFPFRATKPPATAFVVEKDKALAVLISQQDAADGWSDLNSPHSKRSQSHRDGLVFHTDFMCLAVALSLV